MILRELGYRRVASLCAIASIALAVGSVLMTLRYLEVGEAETEHLLKDRRDEVTKAGAALEDAMRKITKGLGFNILILPKDQDLNVLHTGGNLESTMPENYVDRLASSSIVTVNHLLPTLTQRLDWPEEKLPIILYGTRGEVPIMHRDPKKPLLDAVQRGEMIIGADLGEKLQLNEGDTTVFMGRSFLVRKRHAERGTSDDSTIWINLREAQEMFGMENLIHAIQALECQCAGDRLAAIREEIASILPGTQVIERGPPALARAEARNQAKLTAETSLEKEIQHQDSLKAQRERLAMRLLPFALIIATAWLVFLNLGNMRERHIELAALRAVGFRSSQILGLFLGKALLIALIGACLGLGLGYAFGAFIDPNDLWVQWPHRTPALTTIGLGVLLACTVSVFASWIPALMAMNQDPASILREAH